MNILVGKSCLLASAVVPRTGRILIVILLLKENKFATKWCITFFVKIKPFVRNCVSKIKFMLIKNPLFLKTVKHII